jgi:anti-anti-sigma regulatory factor
MPEHPVLHVGVDAGDEATIVTPVGVLATSTVPKLRKILLRCIAQQPTAVIVDLHLLHVRAPANLRMFITVARRTADLAGVRLLVAGQPGEARTLLTRAVARFVTVYPTLDAALASVRDSSARRMVRRRVRQGERDLDPVRSFVDQTCEEWDCAPITENAQQITHELVANALRHARTDAEVRLSLRGRRLLIAVSDGDPRPPKLVPPGPAPRAHGYGLVIVDALARRWGTTPLADGKLVWAALDAPA